MKFAKKAKKITHLRDAPRFAPLDTEGAMAARRGGLTFLRPAKDKDVWA